jgi:hypothetical protein
MMDKLLAAVLDAHGGLSNWQRVRRVTARMTLGGPFWEARGWPGIYADSTVTIDAQRQRITFAPFGARGRTSAFEVAPERVTIRAGDGSVLEERVAPRASFPQAFDPFRTRWDAVQVAYFTSAAVWNYLATPFVFTQPGVEAVEIEPWSEAGRSWRRLAVTFPPEITNHNPHQVFYYDDAYMQRRMDYSPLVTGSPPIAHYTHDPKTFDGFVFPTRRRVHLHDANGVADLQFAPITIDVGSVQVER